MNINSNSYEPQLQSFVNSLYGEREVVVMTLFPRQEIDISRIKGSVEHLCQRYLPPTAERSIKNIIVEQGVEAIINLSGDLPNKLGDSGKYNMRNHSVEFVNGIRVPVIYQIKNFH